MAGERKEKTVKRHRRRAPGFRGAGPQMEEPGPVG